MLHFVGIIPARYASSRFPGKPLADLGGKSVIQRVYEQASKALHTVVVATDDERIYQCVSDFGGNVVMTSPMHTCGTDRVYEAYSIYHQQHKLLLDNQVVVVNIQGDEPFIQPEQVHALMECFDTNNTEIATLVHPFTSNDSCEDLFNPNHVKVVVAKQTATSSVGKALYFSRSVVPFLRGVKERDWLQKARYYRHVGMYAYRADVLKKITQLSPSSLELIESLEQLRWIENGFTIKVAECSSMSIGIDTPEDLVKAIEYLKNEQ